MQTVNAQGAATFYSTQTNEGMSTQDIALRIDGGEIRCRLNKNATITKDQIDSIINSFIHGVEADIRHAFKTMAVD